MPNPVDPGTFDNWITDRTDFEYGTPRSSDTGTFDLWFTDREFFWVYVEAAAAASAVALQPVMQPFFAGPI